ncbi:nitroreductase family protein [Saccharopolyspora flava]|uniref:Nitroreductase family protein n=1 Tax=Saccharopolyspora flava TaxID=95161 RepID=A0A1I6S972_9PSEU|nr:nitroreductase family protein [Saccharopolyspora flava]SFS73420.1 Nitroreductase family protein [Saccharopolyspora flava]
MTVAQQLEDVRAQELEWTPTEIAELCESVSRAPSVHNSRPWTLTLHRRTAVLRENPAALMDHDPQGRDQRISCGAALMNLVLAVRDLGWRAHVEFGATSGLVSAVVSAGEPAEPSPREQRWARSIPQRHSHREPFSRRPVPELLREKIRDAAAGPRCGGRWVGSAAEAVEVARMLSRSAHAFHADTGYTRELTGWATPEGRKLQRASGDLRGLAAVGLTALTTHLPDEHVLARLLREESVLLVGTRGDRAVDHVHAGQAVERAWLEATSAGLSVSMMTQPLHMREVRTALAESLGTSLIPQAIMRFGYPAEG